MSNSPEQTPEFASPAWCLLRDRKLREWIGHDDAVDFIRDFAHVCEVWDDLIDRDKSLEDSDVHEAFWILLTELPLNPFFDQFKRQLIPLLITGINAWMDANELERSPLRNDRVFAYVLRDWYMEFVSYVIYLARGREYLREVSLDVRAFFTHHEPLDEYLEKLP